MIGCVAKTKSENVPEIDQKELEDARWFTPEELKDALFNVRKDPSLRLSFDNNGNPVFVPPKEAIAHHLIKDWLIGHGHIQSSKL